MESRHLKNSVLLICLLSAAPDAAARSAKEKNVTTHTAEFTAKGEKVLWQDPARILAGEIFYGQGGKEHQPRGATFQFTKEDTDGTNPKFTVRDADNVKWKVKLGDEAKPETAATRLVWAAGYFTDEDYFLPEMHVQDLPKRLRRGQELVGPGGLIRNARLERDRADEKKAGTWSWKNASFAHSREWNGLRVLMALLNNWDLKDENNSVYQMKSNPGEFIYVVSDLGATFGPNHLDLNRKTSKGDLATYRRTEFIRHTRKQDVDFSTPGLPAPLFVFTPVEYVRRVQFTSLGRHVPREDARWIGSVLAKMSPKQIRDIFRAGGYSPEEIEGFAAIVEHRIAALREL